MIVGVVFTEGEKQENLWKNTWSTGATNYNNSTHMSSKVLRINAELYPGGHSSSYNPVWSGLTVRSVVKGNALTAFAISAPIAVT